METGMHQSVLYDSIWGMNVLGGRLVLVAQLHE